jgi:hypothetical protein
MLTSPLWVGGEIFLGFSLAVLVGVLIAAFGDKIRKFQLPALDAPQLGHSRIVGRAKLGRSEAALAPRLGPAQGDHGDRKGLALAVTSRKAA